MEQPVVIQRALISVYDKSSIIELAEALHLRGVEILSTGQTATLLKQHGLPVITVSEYTDFPELMDGRVKTLHPKIHGGILGRRDRDAQTMRQHGIQDIDLVIVNLYPFQQVINQPESTFEQIIENIDIGGPTLIRAAAKNHQWCTVLVDSQDYQPFIEELKQHDGAISEQTRLHLATKAFAHTAAYDSTIFHYLTKNSPIDFPSQFFLSYPLKQTLRYGENPHQAAAFYQHPQAPLDSIAQATLLQGKPLSFNNILDSNNALECIKSFKQNACVIVKHANPCGVALDGDLLTAYHKAYACDPISAFGGIIAFNQEVNATLLEQIFAQQFVEVVIAPQFTPQSLTIAQQKPNCRLLQYHAASTVNQIIDIRSVNGGLLVQTPDHAELTYQVVTHHQPNECQWQDLLFSWQVVKFVKSNAIVYAKNGQTLGIGAGQMSRVFSTEIAALKAKQSQLDLNQAVMASDAFFPFKDNIEKAYAYGIRAIIQPGGAQRDQEIIDCANQLGIAMLFTGKRHFCH